LVDWRPAILCERREVGVINIGGSGWVSLDGVRHELARLDSLYIGRGVEAVVFGGGAEEGQAKFYFVSYPAHAAYPSRRGAAKDQARNHPGWRPEDRERRVIRQSIRRAFVENLSVGHGLHRIGVRQCVEHHAAAHSRPPQRDLYVFRCGPGQGHAHHGPPVRNRDGVPGRRRAVFSPSWSMHSGVGTADYRFVWSMGGENLEFDDMDVLNRGGPRLNGRR